MFTILLHTSKTTRQPVEGKLSEIQKPIFNTEAKKLAQYLTSLTHEQIQKAMALSKNKTDQTYELIQNYNEKQPLTPALDIFLGDIYSGIQAQSFTTEDRSYANDVLFILSGLYGVLRPLDQIQPYRLEMGYKFPELNMYAFWADKIAKQLPKNQDIINLSAVEYTRAVLPYIQGTKTIKPLDGHENTKVITPKFLTVSTKTGEPTFVTVHAKIDRGAFARWLIQNRIDDISKLKDFKEIGYQYDETLSATEHPVFVAKEFKGLGLSVRLS